MVASTMVPVPIFSPCRSRCPLIAAKMRSTKNKSGERDPEMHQVRKGKQWCFGMKAHVGVDDANTLKFAVNTPNI